MKDYMLENLTRLQINKKLALPYPSLEAIQNKLEDHRALPLKVYLEKYYKELDIYTNEVWSKVMLKLVEPAFHEGKRDEMIYNFGYTSPDKHDFDRQSQFYSALENDNRLDEDTRKFIGFLAGTHFFDDNTSTIEEWFNSSYWTAVKDIEDYKLPYTINDVLDLPYGLNYFKSVLLGLRWWSRDVTF
jgi:hypothetical protein